MPDVVLEFAEEEYDEMVFEAQAPDFDQPLEGAGWRLARSLQVLRNECNAKAPNRNKSSDGTIGNASHAARPSRHNPNNNRVVCAMDITHDPAHGMDTYAMFDYLRTHPHPDLEYVISNRRIASRTKGWTVRPYGGASPHSRHIHIAVGRGPESEPREPYDDTNAWGISESSTPPVVDGHLKKGSKGDKVKELQTKLSNMGWKLEADGIFGDRTDAIVRSLQGSKGVETDGIVGPNTWKALGTPDRVLKSGMEGKDVYWVQRILNRVQKSGLEEDGKFGKNTEAAIKKFQTTNKLESDGIVGPKTWYELRKQSN